jgi:Zn-dependent protease
LDETAALQAAPRGISPVGPLLLAAWLALGVALARTEPHAAGALTFGFVMVGWILAVALHEFGHAFTAHLAGDHTIAAKGYLSFDPRRYADLGTSLVIPLIALAMGGIGFPGGAVYLREDLMRSRAWRSAAALAGPLGTLIVLLLVSLALRPVAAALPGAEANPLVPALAFLGFLQATALLLNLLPIPGLDGFNAIRPFLPGSWAPAIRRAEGLSMLALLGLLLLVPMAGAIFFALAFEIARAAGLPLDLVQDGFRAFRFWT